LSLLRKNIAIITKKISKNHYKSLLVQLNKDLTLSGIDFAFEMNCLPRVLIEQLTFLVESLIKNDYQKFSQFMYTIDISENKINNIKESNLHKMIEKITNLVLERAVKKVIFKDRYKNI
jgi:hypothetical protein